MKTPLFFQKIKKIQRFLRDHDFVVKVPSLQNLWIFWIFWKNRGVFITYLDPLLDFMDFLEKQEVFRLSFEPL